MNKKILALMFVPFVSAYALDQDMYENLHLTKDQIEFIKNESIKNGDPVPGSGVIVKPFKEMKSYTESRNTIKSEDADIKKYGYIKKPSPDVDILLNFKITAQKAFSKSSGSKGGELKKTVQEVGTAYTVNPLPLSSSEILGVAPSGTFLKDKGWSGFIAFFEKTDIGICHYIQNNLKYSHGAAILAAETVRHDVNGKITNISITGEPGHGFVYDVYWYDDSYFHEMRCAHTEFDKGKINSMIDIAKNIDNSL